METYDELSFMEEKVGKDRLRAYSEFLGSHEGNIMMWDVMEESFLEKIRDESKREVEDEFGEINENNMHLYSVIAEKIEKNCHFHMEEALFENGYDLEKTKKVLK